MIKGKKKCDKNHEAFIFLWLQVFHFCSAIKTNRYVERNYLGSVFGFHIAPGSQAGGSNIRRKTFTGESIPEFLRKKGPSRAFLAVHDWPGKIIYIPRADDRLQYPEQAEFWEDHIHQPHKSTTLNSCMKLILLQNSKVVTNCYKSSKDNYRGKNE